MMTFEEILDQAVAMLQRRGRMTYRALQAQFQLDEALLETLKDELLFSHPVVDQGGRGLVWVGDLAAPEPVSPAAAQPAVLSAVPFPPSETPAAVSPIRDAERRQLTVMFADLADSTALSGQLDLEDCREVLRTYQATCSAVLQRFDGYIAQHLGDALLAYFGFPVTHEDAAQRAIHAGLGMLTAMQTLNTRLAQEHGRRPSIRVGIHTGLTVIGDIGAGQKHELLALGEAPNVASRIQGIAAPDTIAISAETYRLIEGYFTVEDLGLHTLKSVPQPEKRRPQPPGHRADAWAHPSGRTRARSRGALRTLVAG
jgi:class 3 adenylate cyclase